MVATVATVYILLSPGSLPTRAVLWAGYCVNASYVVQSTNKLYQLFIPQLVSETINIIPYRILFYTVSALARLQDNFNSYSS